MAKKTENIEEKFDFDSWINELNNFKLPLKDELPSIDLYMDQVLTYISSKLQPLIDDSDFLTASMINNYVKGKVIKAPKGKKYDTDTMEQLFFITLVKQVLSIAEIKDLLDKDIICHYDQLIDYQNDILKTTIDDIKRNLENDSSKKNLYTIGLKLAIEAEIKKIIVSKIIEATR